MRSLAAIAGLFCLLIISPTPRGGERATTERETLHDGSASKDLSSVSVEIVRPTAAQSHSDIVEVDFVRPGDCIDRPELVGDGNITDGSLWANSLSAPDVQVSLCKP
jgi:hypothetical protein